MARAKSSAIPKTQGGLRKTVRREAEEGLGPLPGLPHPNATFATMTLVDYRQHVRKIQRLDRPSDAISNCAPGRDVIARDCALSPPRLCVSALLASMR